MKKFLEYKGHIGSFEIDFDEGFIYGHLMFIRDVVSYRVDAVCDLKKAFEAAVDDYLATCIELGDAPEMPCKGTFNVRVGADLHYGMAISAALHGIKLNEWVKQACELKLATSRSIADAGSFETSNTTKEMSFEEEQPFGFGGNEDWQTQNNQPIH